MVIRKILQVVYIVIFLFATGCLDKEQKETKTDWQKGLEKYRQGSTYSKDNRNKPKPEERTIIPVPSGPSYFEDDEEKLAELETYSFPELMDNSPVREVELSNNLNDYDFSDIESKSTAKTESQMKEALGGIEYEVMKAIKNRDYETLAEHVHPELGLLFGGYRIHPQKDIILSPEQIRSFATDSQKYRWYNHETMFGTSGLWYYLVKTKSQYFDFFWFDYSEESRKVTYMNSKRLLKIGYSHIYESPKYIWTHGLDYLMLLKIYKDMIFVDCSDQMHAWYIEASLVFTKMNDRYYLVCIYVNDFENGTNGWMAGDKSKDHVVKTVIAWRG